MAVKLSKELILRLHCNYNVIHNLNQEKSSIVHWMFYYLFRRIIYRLSCLLMKIIKPLFCHCPRIYSLYLRLVLNDIKVNDMNLINIHAECIF